jgi:quercetin dioxygenase-like cupin family protein
VTLAAGDLIALPPLTAYSLRNDAAVPAEALVVAVRPPGAAVSALVGCDSANPDVSPTCAAGADPANRGGGDATAAAKVAVWSLVGSPTTGLPPGPATVSVGRVTLAPGAELFTAAADGPSLLYLEAGILDLSTDDGEAWVVHGAPGVGREVAEGTLGAGDGTFFHAGTGVALRNVGDDPVAFLVVTILPDDGAVPTR